MRWLLTPDEFTLVWTRETNLKRRPYPLDTSPWRAESSPPAPRSAPRYLHRNDPELAVALALCARTDSTTVTLYGEHTTGAGTRRILAFAAVAQQRAGILVALPEAVSVTLCPSDQLGRELVEIIGSAPAGRGEELREPQQQVLYPESGVTGEMGRIDRRDVDRPSGAADRFRRKLRKPVDGRGFITVSLEPENPLSPPTRHRTWLDFSGDGRYLLTTDTDLTLTPVDDEELAAALDCLARV